MFDNTAFNTARRDAEITTTELADFMGICRRFAGRVEMCREPATPDFWAALRQMIAERVAA